MHVGRLLRLLLLVFPSAKTAAGPWGCRTKEVKSCPKALNAAQEAWSGWAVLMTQGKLSQSSELDVCAHLQGQKETSLHSPSPASQVLANHRAWPPSAPATLIHIRIQLLGAGEVGITWICFLFLEHTLQGQHCSVHRQSLASPKVQSCWGPPHTAPTRGTPGMLLPPLPSLLLLQGTQRKLCSPVLHPSPADMFEKQLLAIPV